MKIAVVGSGYVGLVTGACLANVGFEVFCIDIDEAKIAKMKRGESPIYEPGLEEIMKMNIEKGRLHFSSDLKLILNEVEVVFSAVGTPPDEDGSADLQYVLEVARTIGTHMNSYKLIVTKSTVPVGTANLVKEAVQKELKKRNAEIPFDVASNPEFLKEGDAVNDFLHPDRIVVGVESERAKLIFERLYHPFALNGHPIIFTDIASAEMIKYAANAMLATRISFMNDIANLCEIVGADVDMVKKGIGSDSRIGSKFLNAGAGYGGSCLPKDVKALIKTAEKHYYSLEVLKAVEKVNDKQKSVLFNKLEKYYNKNLKGKKIAILGLAFKPNTDDMREAPSLVLIEHLLSAGCEVSAYDPVAMSETKRKIGERIYYCNTAEETLVDADALLLVTEWSEFKALNPEKLVSLMKKPLLFDGRNIYDDIEMRKMGVEYFGIGR
ncbi:MAG: UDP-glucose/GDP-mannose dehydrogenase family protein [Bacteroidetes bacterium]|nr:UDP-glucose/GDP-mannose dehydrogenase family protein [Bacteroidota bacterium]MCL2303644.1 UDP-glucose/GDP-mannose dehydrogenase family protein [Lentimicrobiaceae bacterium]